eukprot:GEMP01024148.1.p1 GENE.GEMP01024148.1~~GEMP01024148.1.p1  ORF type:complete len:200 (+),score=17.42 GEMP01024148.1:927-1526(+)
MKMPSAFTNGTDIYNMFQSIFDTLPLYTIIDNKIFVVHGGLPRVKNGTVTKEALTNVDHKRPYPSSPESDGDMIFADALWAVPRREKGIRVLGPTAGRRSGITEFGPDVTEAFLKSMKLTKVVLSHAPSEKASRKYTFHKKKGFTIFSASNYNMTGNVAAVMVLDIKPDGITITVTECDDVGTWSKVKKYTCIIKNKPR